MIQGSEKRMICIRDTRSRIFTEAYFILREDASAIARGDMVSEAMRIIRERTQNPSRMLGKKRLDKRSFIIGAVSGLIFSAAAIAVYAVVGVILKKT